MQHTGERALDPLTLIVTPAAGGARGKLYEDDGDGFGYAEGRFRLSTYRCHRSGEDLRIELVDSHGRSPAPRRRLEVIALMEDGSVRRASAPDTEPVYLPKSAFPMH